MINSLGLVDEWVMSDWWVSDKLNCFENYFEDFENLVLLKLSKYKNHCKFSFFYNLFKCRIKLIVKTVKIVLNVLNVKNVIIVLIVKNVKTVRIVKAVLIVNLV